MVQFQDVGNIGGRHAQVEPLGVLFRALGDPQRYLMLIPKRSRYWSSHMLSSRRSGRAVRAVSGEFRAVDRLAARVRTWVGSG